MSPLKGSFQLARHTQIFINLCLEVFTDHINGTAASEMCFSQKQENAVFLAPKSRCSIFEVTYAELNPNDVYATRDFAADLSDH